MITGTSSSINFLTATFFRITFSQFRYSINFIKFIIISIHKLKMKLNSNGVLTVLALVLILASSEVKSVQIGSSQLSSAAGIFDKAVKKMNEKENLEKKAKEQEEIKH